MPTVAETINKVNEFADLPIGWHFGEGVPPLEVTRQDAVNLLSVAQLLDIKRTNAFPGVSGQIQVTFYHEERMLELTLEVDNTVTIAEDEGNVQLVFKEGASKAEAQAALLNFSQNIWTSSESYIEGTMTRSVKTSQVRRWIYQGMNPSPSWGMIAQLMLVGRSVGTLPCSTANRLVNPPFTGVFPKGSFPPVVGLSKKEAIRATIATTIFTVGEENKHEGHLSH